MRFDLDRLERDMTMGMAQLLVLGLVRAREPIHGYGLIKALEETTDRTALWKEGTIYPLLSRLEKAGLLESHWGDPPAGARRKYYECTPAGARALAEATTRWTHVRDAMDRILKES